MRANIPPDLLAVIDGLHLHQVLHIAIEMVPGIEDIGHAAPWKALPNDCAIRFDASQASLPEGGIGGEGQQMRQPRPRLIHNFDLQLFIWYGYMHVEAEDQNRASNILVLFFQLFVALVFGALLIEPVRARMRASAIPSSLTRRESNRRAEYNSLRAALRSGKTSEIYSTVDCSISGLIFSSKYGAPLSSLLCTHEHRSPESSFTNWNSSSTPSVKRSAILYTSSKLTIRFYHVYAYGGNTNEIANRVLTN